MNGGPSITALTGRLTMTPPSLLSAPTAPDGADTAAIVIDTLLDLGAPLPEPGAIKTLTAPQGKNQPNHFILIHIACFLLHDPWFLSHPPEGERVTAFLFENLRSLAAVAPAERFVTEPEGREELARRCLAVLGLLPEGENAAQADDRLRAVDSVERRRVIEKTQGARKRAEEIREAIARREAEEAASKMSRE